MQELQNQVGKGANHFEVTQSLLHATMAHDLMRLLWLAPHSVCRPNSNGVAKSWRTPQLFR